MPKMETTMDALTLAKKIPVQPEFIRLPAPGERDPMFGLGRSFLNSLVLPCKGNGYKPPVRSFVLRRRGRRTGVRLIDVASLRAFILAHEQKPGEDLSATA